MRSSFSKRLQKAREAKGLSQTELARLAKIPPQRISKIETSNQKSSPYIFVIAEILGVKADWLAGKSGNDDEIEFKSESPLHKDSISLTSIGRVTVRGVVEASNWAEACEWSEDQQYEVSVIGIENQAIPYKIDNLFGLEVRGESMNVQYNPGDILLCIPLPDDLMALKDGHNVIVRRESSKGCETTVKKLRINKETGKYELHFNSHNPDYKGILPLFNPKIAYTEDEVTISIIARVVNHIPRWE